VEGGITPPPFFFPGGFFFFLFSSPSFDVRQVSGKKVVWKELRASLRSIIPFLFPPPFPHDFPFLPSLSRRRGRTEEGEGRDDYAGHFPPSFPSRSSFPFSPPHADTHTTETANGAWCVLSFPPPRLFVFFFPFSLARAMNAPGSREW